MEKLTATAKKIDTLFRILRGLLIAALIVCLICLGIIAAGQLLDLPAKMVGTNFNEITLGSMTFTIAPDYAPDPWRALQQTAVALTMAPVAAAFALMAVKRIRAILKPMMEGRPFHQDISKHLCSLGLYAIILGVWTNLMQYVSQASVSRMLDLPGLITGEKITGITMNYTFDLTFLAVAAVLYLLAYVFRYGAELQTLSDETL